ncbi:MAG: Fic family protein, partial [Clostridia bacterium]
MEKYIPPYTITTQMLSYVSEIMEKVGKLNNYYNLEKMPVLRKNNRIKSIHSSLAIEANSLSLEQVKDVINGKIVMGPEKEIQEVKNAYDAYSMIKDLDPYSIKDLLKVHEIITRYTVTDGGKFRNCSEGVFDGDKCIFIAPPKENVPKLMDDLFSYMKDSSKEIHPLILSSIFHYEFLFIHPFSDGNGRTARLWQNVILSDFKEIFEYLPIETQIKKYQQEYYNAIATCHKNGESNVFIEFMLKMINEVLNELEEETYLQSNCSNRYLRDLLNVMELNAPLTANEIMEKLHVKSKETLRKNYLDPAIAEGLVNTTLPDKPTSK